MNDDNLKQIFVHCARDYKQILFTCRRFAQLITTVFPRARIELCNHLLTLIKLFPDAKWSHGCLLMNPNMRWKDILCAGISIDTNLVLRNRSITWEDSDKLQGLRGNKYSMSINPNITWDIITANPDYDWNIQAVSKNPNITWEIIAANPDFGWDMISVTINPNITWDIISANPDYEWNIRAFSKKLNITERIVLNNPEIEWDWFWLSGTLDCSWEFLRKNIDCGNINPSHGLNLLSNNRIITWQIIQDNQDVEWNWFVISKHRNITFDIIKANLSAPWHFDMVSKNPNITWEIIVANPTFAWNWKSISRNRFTKARQVKSVG